jgi:hypothetical protein
MSPIFIKPITKILEVERYALRDGPREEPMGLTLWALIHIYYIRAKIISLAPIGLTLVAML